VTDATRYQRGEIWWFQNRDDIAHLSSKIHACQVNAANATRFTRRLGCFIQRQKLQARRLLTSTVKSTTKGFVDKLVRLRNALTGPRGTQHIMYQFNAATGGHRWARAHARAQWARAHPAQVVLGDGIRADPKSFLGVGVGEMEDGLGNKRA